MHAWAHVSAWRSALRPEPHSNPFKMSMDPRALLDELMGRERNVPLAERSNRSTSYDDPAVCKFELGGLCPHKLFRNTKSDLGPCQYELHSDHLDWAGIIEDFERQDDHEKERYEKKLHRYLEGLVRDMDRKIAKSKDRAEKESAPKPVKPEDQGRLDELQQRAKECVEKSQQLGEEGDVDQAMMLTQQADAYKKQYDEMLKRATAPDRTMMVCDICGVFINSTDNDERRWDHLNGKQFLGWKAIRDKYAKLQERFASRPSGSVPPEERAEGRGRERERERERSPRRDERYRDERYRDERYRDERYRDSRPQRDERGYDRGYERGYERGDYRGGSSRGGGGRDARDAYSSRGGAPYSGGGARDGYPEERRRY